MDADMKLYHILNSFAGSQNGIDHQEFHAGTTTKLSDSLAAIVVPEGWAKLAEPESLTHTSTQKLNADPDAPNELVESTADGRETKVTGPTETKPAPKKGKK